MRIIPILVIALLAGACSRKTPAPAVVRPVKVTTAAGAGLIDKDFAGMATPDDAVNLAFKVAGQVLDVPVSQGAGVKKGELLAELDPRDLELQVAATRSAFEEARSITGKPVCIVAETVKGKGVSFMEGQVGWHGKAPNDEQFEQAMAELAKEA